MTVYIRASNGKAVSLGNQIASSGEGEVWETNQSGILAKIYHNPTPERIEKLKVMLANPPVDPMASQNHVSIAFPQDLLKNQSGAYVGFLMPAIRQSRELTSVYNPSLRKRKAPGFNWYYLHATALNTAWIIQVIHDKGYVLGDIKPQNILVSDRALVAVIDTDSFQVRDSHTGKVYRCTVGSEGFTPVELLGKDFSTTDQTEIHDRFRLAVLIHYLLFGYHPFSGQWTGVGESPEQTELIRKGFWYGGQNSLIRPSLNTIPLDVVHPDLKRCFLQCFNDGHTTPDLRPTAEDWHNALQVALNELIACDKVDSHYYSQSYGKCYWCERTAKLGVDIFPGVSGTSSTAVKTITTLSTPAQTTPSSTPSSQNVKQSTSQPLANSPPTLSLPLKPSIPSPVASVIPSGKLKKPFPVASTVLLLGLGICVYSPLQTVIVSHLSLIRSLDADSGAIAISPDGQTLVNNESDGNNYIIQIRDLKTGTLKSTLTRDSKDVNAVTISPDGQTLVSASRDDTIKIWDLSTGTLRTTLKGLSGVTSVAISPNGQTLVSNGGGCTIKIWDLNTGYLQGTIAIGFDGEFCGVTSVAISPDGKTLVGGLFDPSNENNTIKIWDLNTGILKTTLKAGFSEVNSVVISPDGKTLASSGTKRDAFNNWEHTIKIWDLSTGALRSTLKGHSNYIRAMAVSPDSQTLVSGSYDTTIKIWDLSTGILKSTLSAGEMNCIESLAFSPDGQTLVSAVRYRIKFWRMPS